MLGGGQGNPEEVKRSGKDAAGRQLHIKGKEADRSDKRIYLGDGKNGTEVTLSPDANGSS